MSSTHALVLTEDQRLSWTRLVEKRIGMQMPDSRLHLLEKALKERLAATGLEDLDKYYALVTTPVKGVREWQEFVNRITIQETRFFRHPAYLEYLSDTFIPQARLFTTGRPLRIWSMGCATGEEVWSLLLMLDTYRATRDSDLTWEIYGTDIASHAIQVARHGCYPASVLKAIPAAYQQRSLEPCPAHPDRWRCKAPLHRTVGFIHANMLLPKEWPPGFFDIIMCHNVLIYFQRPLRHELLAHWVTRLSPGGVCLVGPGEALGFTPPPTTFLVRDARVFGYQAALSKTRSAGGKDGTA